MVRRARWIYPTLVCVLIIVYFAAPIVRVADVVVIGFLSAAVVAWSAAMRDSSRRVSWVLIAAAIVIVTLGALAYAVFGAAGAGSDFPVTPDGFTIGAYPLLAVGLIWLNLPRRPGRDTVVIIEIAALSLAASLLTWALLLHPTMASLPMTNFGRIVGVAVWIGDVIVVAAAIRMVCVGWRSLAAILLGAAIVALFVADLLYGKALLDGDWHSAGPYRFALILFFALSGLAALAPSMPDLGRTAPDGRPIRMGTVIALSIALLVAPSVLLAEATSGPVHAPAAIALVAAVVTILVIMRLVIAVREHARALDREVVIRRASWQLGLAMSADDVVTSLGAALASMASARSDTSVRIDMRASRSDDAATLASRPGIGVLRLPLGLGIAKNVVPPEVITAEGQLTGAGDEVATRAYDQLPGARRVLRATDGGDTTEVSSPLQGGAGAPNGAAATGVIDAPADAAHLNGGSVAPVAQRIAIREIRRERRDVVFVAAPNDLEDLHAVLGGLADQASVALDRIELAARVHETEREQDVLVYRASHDGLTGLANAELFRDELREARRTASPAPDHRRALHRPRRLQEHQRHARARGRRRRARHRRAADPIVPAPRGPRSAARRRRVRGAAARPGRRSTRPQSGGPADHRGAGRADPDRRHSGRLPGERRSRDRDRRRRSTTPCCAGPTPRCTPRRPPGRGAGVRTRRPCRVRCGAAPTCGPNWSGRCGGARRNPARSVVDCTCTTSRSWSWRPAGARLRGPDPVGTPGVRHDPGGRPHRRRRAHRADRAARRLGDGARVGRRRAPHRALGRPRRTSASTSPRTSCSRRDFIDRVGRAAGRSRRRPGPARRRDHREPDRPRGRVDSGPTWPKLRSRASASRSTTTAPGTRR